MKAAHAARDARALALQALSTGGTQAALDRVLRAASSGKPADAHAARDRALVTQLTYGTVKMRRALQWSLQRHLRKPFAALDPALQNVLLLGAYQLLYLEKIPAHSAVDESVRLARQHGHAGTAAVANAVLRKLSREPVCPAPPNYSSDVAGLADFASVPDWLARHWTQRFGFDTALRIAAGVNAPARRALRVNTARVSADVMRTELAAQGLSLQPSRYGIPACVVLDERGAPLGAGVARAARLGLLTVQSEESQLATHLLHPRSGEIIIDVCAGRGVKAGAIAEQAAPATLYALDDDEAKLRALSLEFTRLHLVPPHVVASDARLAYPASVAREAAAVLVDAPCSAIGIVGRRAEVRWTKDPSDPKRLATTQLALVTQAASAVRKGGRMLYAVCSTASEEGEDVVNAFLAAAAGWRSEPFALTAPAGQVIRLGDYALSIPGIEGADGFFYALLVRRE